VPDIVTRLWSKVLVYSAINPLSGVLRVKNGHLIEKMESVSLAKRLIDEGREVAEAYGFYGSHWTLDRITQVIWQEFGVRYHPSSVWHILRKLGWSSQRPQRRPFNRDDKAIENWKDEVLPEIKKSAVS